MSKAEREQLKRRQVIEPAIAHTKHDNRMIRCHFKGGNGNALHAISCAAGYNIRRLMRAILRLGLKGLFARVSGRHAVKDGDDSSTTSQTNYGNPLLPRLHAKFRLVK